MNEEYDNRDKKRWEDRRDRWMDRRERWRNRMDHGNRHSHLWTGLFILIIGIAALIKASATSLPDWIFSWQMFLILLGFFSGIKHSFRGGAWLVMIAIGGVFLWPELNPDVNIKRYIWPSAIIGIGLILMLKPRRRYKSEIIGAEKKNDGSLVTDKATIVIESFDTKEDYVDSTSIFGGAKKNIISKNFKGGDLVNIFGGTELDLTRADFTGTAVVELTTIFGGTKFIVPSNWTVKSEAVTIFGGMEDKRNTQALTDNPDKVLLLIGTVIFGGIEIKSY